jgi:hypothetical protein
MFLVYSNLKKERNQNSLMAKKSTEFTIQLEMKIKMAKFSTL